MKQLSRLLVLTFFLLTFFAGSDRAFAFPGKFSVSPDSSQGLLLEAIQSAKQSINLNVYMISNSKLQQALLDQFNKGVVINMLIEAEPFGGKITEAEKKMLTAFSQAFQQSKAKQGKSHVYIITSQHGTKKRRYVYDHAKYITIDGKRAYVSSENFVSSSAMADPGKKGNRGWQALVDDPSTAKTLDGFFATDTDPSFGDVVEFDPSLVDTLDPPAHNPDIPPPNNDRSVQNFPVMAGDVSKASICASPNSLSCMVDFMRSAKQSLVLEHLSLPMNWSAGSAQSDATTLNPIIAESIAAAKRGVKVRIILNASDSAALPTAAPPAQDSAQAVVDYIKGVARDQRLSIDAALINNKDLELTILHNKGMVADNARAWVSSINGTDNSVINNREVALRLESLVAARYFSDVFELDWAKSAQ